jgi:LacI family transcriptional regulator
VFVDNYSESPLVNRVGIDDRQGGVLAAQHLLDKGHRTLGFVGPPIPDVGVICERHLGFTEAARGRVDEIHTFECDPRFEDGRDLAAKRLSTDPARPTGLFATADVIAIGLLNGFLRSGISVPGQVSLIGFDDIPEASHGRPELTTIHQDVGAKARAAVKRLVELMKPDPDPRDPLPLDVQLMQRDTVGPPPSRSNPLDP